MKLKHSDVVAILVEAAEVERERLRDNGGVARTNPGVFLRWQKRHAAFLAAVEWLTQPESVEAIGESEFEPDPLSNSAPRQKLQSLREFRAAERAAAVGGEPARPKAKPEPRVTRRGRVPKVRASEVEMPTQGAPAATTPIDPKDAL